MLIFQTHGQGTGCFFPGHYLRLASGIATVFSRSSTFARCSRRTPAISHPYAASVRILSTRFEKDNGSLPADFNGYSAITVPSQEFDGDNKPVGAERFGREYITLDEESFPGAAIPIAELSAPLPDVDPFVQRNP
jgi:hypothetical protein